MPEYKFTLSSYEPVYAVCPEVRIAEEAIRAQAKRWLELNHCTNGEKPRLTDSFVKQKVPELKNVEGLMAFIRYNMYRDNREVQRLADQNVICAKLAERLVEDLPEELVEQAQKDSRYRLEDMLSRSGLQAKDYCKQRGITEDQLYKDVEERTIQSLREDSALKAWVAQRDYTLTPEDFYAIIPGESIEDKAAKRRQMELEGRLPGMEEYAKMTKALNEIMDNAMVKRSDDPSLDYVRYGDVSTNVMDAVQNNPEFFVNMAQKPL